MIKKLNKYRKISAILELVSGLHIGGSKDTIEIGGNDQPIIRNPLTQEPYIPGSSLKGKMRTLLEWKLGYIDPDGKPYSGKNNPDDKDNPIIRIFGTTKNNIDFGPTRIIVNDANLTVNWKENIYKNGANITEDKYENSINRLKGTADNPRPIERVVPGVQFDFSISYRDFELEEGYMTDEKHFDYVLLGLFLLEQDVLGGSGSRGCGRICFKDIKIDDEIFQNMDELFEKKIKKFITDKKI